MSFRVPGKVLVVDDDKSVRLFCSEVLGIAGYGVRTASDGLDAMRSLKEEICDFVLSDIHMPGANGIELYKEAARTYPVLAENFLFMTSYLSDEMQGTIAALNARCLIKPFRIADLLREVDLLMVMKLEGLRARGLFSRSEFCAENL